MKRICITNQKGGCGKTSTTVLLTLGLASSGNKVLAVDCDPQAGLTTFLLDNDKVNSGIFDLLTGGIAEPIQINRGGICFDLLPADHRLDKIYSTLSPFELEKHFKKTPYDIIIFDTPPTVQGISRAAAIIADKILIPADISRATISPTLYTLESLKEIKKTGKVYLLGKEPEKNKHGFVAQTTREFLKSIGMMYGGTIAKSVAMQRAVSGGLKWTATRIDKILKPILETVKI